MSTGDLILFGVVCFLGAFLAAGAPGIYIFASMWMDDRKEKKR